jgi:hypothetical protein
MMSTQWYLYKDGQQQGPFSRQALDQKAQTGAFGPADLVWTEGMENWARADLIKDLFAAAAPPPAPSPAPPPDFAPAYHPRRQDGYQTAPVRKKGRGGFAALVILLVLILAVGSFLAVTYLLNDTDEVAALVGESGVEESSEEQAVQRAEGVFRTVDVEGITVELAAVIDHMIDQGINVTDVQLQVVGGAFWHNPEAGVSVSTDKTFFELFHYDLETADQKTLDFLDNVSEEAYALNDNILMYKPDRFGDDEPEEYTEAVEAIIAAFVSF